MSITHCPTCCQETTWYWTDAFDKFGFEDGDGIVMTEHVAETLTKRFQGVGGLCSRPRGGRHEPCSGRIASEAHAYPKALCRALFKGVTDQLRADGLLKQGCYGIQVADDDLEVLKSIYGPEQGFSGRYKDNITGQLLKDELEGKTS